MSSSFNVYIGTEEVNGRANEFLSLRSLSLSFSSLTSDLERIEHTVLNVFLSISEKESESTTYRATVANFTLSKLLDKLQSVYSAVLMNTFFFSLYPVSFDRLLKQRRPN